MGQKNIRKPHNKCPIEGCGGGMKIRTSELITPVYKKETRQCNNPYCGLVLHYESAPTKVIVGSALDPTNAGLTP